jgi:hypothetical protein
MQALTNAKILIGDPSKDPLYDEYKRNHNNSFLMDNEMKEKARKESY